MLTDLRMRNILKIFSAQRESDRAAKNIEPDALKLQFALSQYLSIPR